MPERASKLVLVAAIAGAFGVRGEVRIKSFTQDPAACLDYAPFVDEQGQEILHVQSSRAIKGGLAVRAQEVQTREQALALKGTRLYAPRSAFAALEEEDDYYQSDLLGLRVENETGEALGTIKAVQNYGAGDLLEITSPGTGQSWTLPFTRHHVPLVDVAGGKVVVSAYKAFLSPQDDAPEEEKPS